MTSLSLYIARRLLKKGDSAVSSIVRIAMIGVSIGTCIILLSLFVTMGFKNEVSSKISGFSATLTVDAAEVATDFAQIPISPSPTLQNDVNQLRNVDYSYLYVDRTAILKSHSEIHGMTLKGVDEDFNYCFFCSNIKSGSLPNFGSDTVSNELLISKKVADILNVSVGDKVIAYFVQNPIRTRAFNVCGTFDTGFDEYDEMMGICDMRHLQKINGWSSSQVSGLGIVLKDLRNIDETKKFVSDLCEKNEGEEFLDVKDLRQSAPQIFDWLALLDMNVWVILILVILVSGFNMISGVLVIILDRTPMIGVMKSLGMKNSGLRHLFVWMSVGIIGKGMLWGNVIALLMAFVQWRFHIVHLDASAYYMSFVPVYIDVWMLIVANVLILLATAAMMLLPASIVARVNPIKSLAFE